MKFEGAELYGRTQAYIIAYVLMGDWDSFVVDKIEHAVRRSPPARKRQGWQDIGETKGRDRGGEEYAEREKRGRHTAKGIAAPQYSCRA
jgi:hypothetical protein